MAVYKINLKIIIICIFKIVFLTTVSADSSPALQCFMTMQTYCNKDDYPTAFKCASSALLNWQTPLPFDYMQEYHAILYNQLVINGIETPTDFCRRKRFEIRKECSDALEKFQTQNRCGKKEQLIYAVRYAFFEAGLSNRAEGSNTQATTSHKKNKPSYNDQYLQFINQNINVDRLTFTPEEYCRIKFEPGYKIPALKGCLINMEYYCRLRDPTALDCVRAAFQLWTVARLARTYSYITEGDMHEYYVALYHKLNIDDIDTPNDFCNKKRNHNRPKCRTDLKNYYTDQRCKREQRVFAVGYAFFNAVLSSEIEGTLPRKYEDQYILSIQEKIILEDAMDSPEEFCRIKHEPGYKKPV